MNGPPPRVAAASADRRSLANEIAAAVQSGCSVALISAQDVTLISAQHVTLMSVPEHGGHDTDDILGLTAVALAGGNVRVLALRPPWDSPSFIRQFAAEWRASGLDADLTATPVTLPKASGERFAMLLHQAHLVPPETVRHLERLAQAWPGMQMVFAGEPGIAETMRSHEYPTLAHRVSRVIEMPVADDTQRPHPASKPPNLSAFDPPPPALPISPTMIVDAYPPIPASPRAVPAPPQPPAPSTPAAPLQPVPQGMLPRLTTWGLAGLVAIAILATPAIPRLPRTSRSTLPATQFAMRTPDPAATPVQPPPEAPKQALTPPTTPPITQNIAPDSLPPAPPPAAEAPAAIDPIQPAAPAPTPPQPPALARTEAAEDAPVPPLRTSSSPSVPSPSPAMADAMTRRGTAMLEIGDVSAARLLLARAASAGSGPAALAMGTTFEAATLERIGAVGIIPDPLVAAAWFRFALALGEDRAQTMLDALTAEVATRSKDPP